MWYGWCECEKDIPLEARHIKAYNGSTLRSGKTKSCGCYKKEKEKMKAQATKDITDMQFGRLKAIESTGTQLKDGSFLWKCECQCDNHTICYYPVNQLISGHVKSCGCLGVSAGEKLIEDLLKKYNIHYIKEYKFSDLYFSNKNNLARYEFYVNNKYLIEYDGIQHFKYQENTHGWNNQENHLITIKHDQIKNNYCIEHNIPLIRIPYWHLNNLTIEDLLLETSTFIYKEQNEN